MNLISFCNKVIEYSYYALFFLVPLVFLNNTAELFEFNKMWLAFGVTIIIAGAWFTKMIVTRQIFIQKTPLDIPIILFLISQIISTIISLDPHVSWWGYYTRWNGGLLSIITYIFLYYAFVSSFLADRDADTNNKHRLLEKPASAIVKRLLSISLISGTITALWGFPSHFGYDPTCLLFRGTLDTACWTEAFKPTVRVFSTLGQPAWFSAYLNVLIPIAIAYALRNAQAGIFNFRFLIFFALTLLFYLDLIFTNTRAGFIAFVIADIILWVLLFYKRIFSPRFLFKTLLIFHIGFFLCNFFFGMPHAQLNRFSFSEISKSFTTQQAPATPKNTPVVTDLGGGGTLTETGITDSGKIRLIVWKGAIDAWKSSPLFGTGVETFAFAYYKFRPQEHNMTSEWDYLYNKAHNEYLNYLTTTGIFGLGSYLLIILFFIFQFLKNIQLKPFDSAQGKHVHSELVKPLRTSDLEFLILSIVLFAGWVSILITNFWGFSVVIMNLYLFLIPAFVFILQKTLDPKKALQSNFSDEKSKQFHINPYQWTMITIFFLIACYFLLSLFRYWYADTAYALGANLNRTNSYDLAAPRVMEAAQIKPNEPVYADELSINLGTLGAAYLLQKDMTTGLQLTQNALELSKRVTTEHPNNVVFWKNRVRLMYTLAQGDPQNQLQYLTEALLAIEKAHELAPTDAKISYNLGLLYSQTGNFPKGIQTLENTLKLKPDYKEAYIALGTVYHEAAIDKDGKVINTALQDKAEATMQYILKNISPNDKQVQDTLKLWQTASGSAEKAQ